MGFAGNQGLTFGPRKLQKKRKKSIYHLRNLTVLHPMRLEKGKVRPIYQHVNVHMIFDINMDGKFTKKENLVADVHTTAPP